MRLPTRLTALSIVCFVSICLLTPRLDPIVRFKKVKGKIPNTLVVFGDAWSDNGIRPGSESDDGQRPTWGNIFNSSVWRSADDELPVWTTQFCSNLLCNDHYNFAKNGSALDLATIAIVQNYSYLGYDFESQIEDWSKLRKGVVREDGKGRLLYVAWFSGITDIWEYSVLDPSRGKAAVMASIGKLFTGFDKLSRISSNPITVFVPHAVDITMLPQFRRATTEDPTGQRLRNVIALLRVWNDMLDRLSVSWANGKIIVWDVNAWFLHQIRHPNDNNWMNVFDECLQDQAELRSLKYRNSFTSGGALSKVACERPDKYLLWDGETLSQAAHAKIAKVAASLVEATRYAESSKNIGAGSATAIYAASTDGSVVSGLAGLSAKPVTSDGASGVLPVGKMASKTTFKGSKWRYPHPLNGKKWHTNYEQTYNKE